MPKLLTARSAAALALAAVALAAAACGGSDGDSAAPAPTPPAEPAEPSAPAEPAPAEPSAPAEPAPAEPAPGDGASGTMPAGPGITIDEALAIAGPVFVRGYLLVENGTPRLCSALLESYPPQCGGSSLQVEDLDLSQLGGLTAADPAQGADADVQWSDAEVSLFGTIENGVLLADMDALAAA